MLKSTRKLVKLLRGLPKIRIKDNKRFMSQLWTRIRRYESERFNKRTD